MDVLGSAANTREHGLGALSDAYEAVALVQFETLHRRAAAGSGMTGLHTVRAALEAGIAAGDRPTGGGEACATLLRLAAQTPGFAVPHSQP